ncbi:MAG: hypothetical protein ACK4RZ_07485 [Paracoccaceae bacterium]
MTGGVPGLSLAASLVMLLVMPCPLQAQDTTEALRAELTLSDPQTGQVVHAQVSRPVRITVNLTDVVTGQSPRGLVPRFFARPLGAGAPSCEQTSRAFRATGRVPAGAVDFGTPLLVTETADGAIGVADPKLNLQSANMLAAFRPDSPSRGLAADPVRGRLIVAEPVTGTVSAVPVTGGTTEVLLAGLNHPHNPVVVDDILHIAVDGGLLRLLLAGGAPETISLSTAGPVNVRVGGDGVLVFATSGQVWAAGDALDLAEPIVDATFAGPGAVLSVSGAGMDARLTYLDAPDAPVMMPMGRAFQRISADPQGKIAVAWSPGDAAFALMDLAIGQTVQAGGLANGTIAEVQIFGEMAYLLSLDGGFVGVIALSSVRSGEAVAMSRVLLGPTSAPVLPMDPETEDQVQTRLLVPMGSFGPMMAVVPSVQTAFTLDPVMALNGQPPMDGTRLRGGVPVRVISYNRGFAETASGRFQSAWAFSAGPWELVVTTGPAGFSACLPFDVDGLRPEAGEVAVRLSGHPQRVTAGQTSSLSLRFVDDHGAPVRVGAADFVVPALGSGWRETYRAVPQGDGSLRLDLTLPHAGPFAVQPVSLPPGLRLRSALVIDAEVAP